MLEGCLNEISFRFPPLFLEAHISSLKSKELPSDPSRKLPVSESYSAATNPAGRSTTRALKTRGSHGRLECHGHYLHLGRNFGYQRRNVSSNPPFSTLVRVCSNRCAPIKSLSSRNRFLDGLLSPAIPPGPIGAYDDQRTSG